MSGGEAVLADDALSFFDQIFSLVPEPYRPIHKVESVQGSKKKEKGPKGPSHADNGGLSLVELKERAQKRIMDIQQANREKSQQKIKQLTEQHT